MTKKEVRCKVLGLSDGPVCAECNKGTDTIEILSKSHPNHGEKAYYCYHCSKDDVRRA